METETETDTLLFFSPGSPSAVLVLRSWGRKSCPSSPSAVSFRASASRSRTSTDGFVMIMFFCAAAAAVSSSLMVPVAVVPANKDDYCGVHGRVVKALDPAGSKQRRLWSVWPSG